MSETFTITKARYAKDSIAVHCVSDGSGFKTWPMCVTETIGGRWSNREKAYILAASKEARLRQLIDECEPPISGREGEERMVMNIKLLKRLRTRFLRMRHEEHFKMDVIAVKTDCGSAMCIAGHTLDLAGYKRKPIPEEDRNSVLDFDFITPQGRKVRQPLAAAAKEMGLNYRRKSGNKAFDLFHDWELETPKQAAARIQELIESAGEP